MPVSISLPRKLYTVSLYHFCVFVRNCALYAVRIHMLPRKLPSAICTTSQEDCVTFCGIIQIKCAFIWICESFFVTLQVNRKQDATFVSGVIGGGN